MQYAISKRSEVFYCIMISGQNGIPDSILALGELSVARTFRTRQCVAGELLRHLARSCSLSLLCEIGCDHIDEQMDGSILNTESCSLWQA